MPSGRPPDSPTPDDRAPPSTPDREPILSDPAYLLLEDGRAFRGVGYGASGVALGEVVFNTSMTGYQEILTDPSYSGQLVTMTYPLIGNYGVTTEDEESDGPKVSGFILREPSRIPSNWRAQKPLDEYLDQNGVVAIAEIDTRALTRHIRSEGAMRAAIAPSTVDPESLMDRILAHPRMEGLDLACGVSTSEPYVVEAVGAERFHVMAYDFGVKANSPALMAQRGCKVTVLPALSAVEEVLAAEPDGIFISNGPGDPAAVEHANALIRELSDRGVPIFGICLGLQLIARAFGARTFKLPFGHHGGNHPVKNLAMGTVEITSQNHGFAVEATDDQSVPGAPDLEVTHRNLYDGTVEGLRHKTRPVFCVQYHPEAAPGPHDSRYLFDDFIEMMEAASPAVGRS